MSAWLLAECLACLRTGHRKLKAAAGLANRQWFSKLLLKHRRHSSREVFAS